MQPTSIEAPTVPSRSAAGRTLNLPPMSYLSVRQPWAHAIVTGIKPIENRSWKTSFRGPLLIHAGKSRSDME